MNNFNILCEEIISRSESKAWGEAKLEWQVLEMEEADRDDPETCLCGKYPIIDVFTLKNKKNGNLVRVGSSCVNKFIIKNKNFDGYKRISKDEKKSVNIGLLRFAKDNNWISLRDFSFYVDIIDKRKLSEKQLKWKISINNTIIDKIRSKKSNLIK